MNSSTKDIIKDHFQKQTKPEKASGNKIQFIPIKQGMMVSNQVKTLKPYQQLNIDLTGSEFQKAGQQMMLGGNPHHQQSVPQFYKRDSMAPQNSASSPGARSTNSNDSAMYSKGQPSKYQHQRVSYKGDKPGFAQDQKNTNKSDKQKMQQLKSLVTKQQSNRQNSFGYFKNNVANTKSYKGSKILVEQDYKINKEQEFNQNPRTPAGFSTLQDKHNANILKRNSLGARNLSAGGSLAEPGIVNIRAGDHGRQNAIDVLNDKQGKSDADQKSKRSRSGSNQNKSRSQQRRNKYLNKSNRSKSNSSLNRGKQISSQMITNEDFSDKIGIQSLETEEQNSVGKTVKIGGIETFGQRQISDITTSESKAKTNTEFFKELLRKSCRIQQLVIADLEDRNKIVLKEASQMPGSTPDHQVLASLFELQKLPRVSNAARSFKEVAESLLSQIEFLHVQGALKKQNALPKGILKKGSQSNRSASDQEGDNHNRSVINLKQIQEKKDLEEQLLHLQSENKYCRLQNSNLQAQLKEMNLQFAKESQKFMKEFENQHGQMEKQFESLSKQHEKQYEHQQNEAEEQMKSKTMEMEKYLQELRQCQRELKKLNDVKRTQHADKGKSVSSFSDFEQKNAPEIQAELDFARDQVTSLEAEIRSMDIELGVYRCQGNQANILQEQILTLETQNLQLKGHLEVLKNQKDFFEKEYKIQSSQLERQNQRLQEQSELGGIPLPREKTPAPTETLDHLQQAIGSNMNYLQTIQKDKSVSKSRERVDQFKNSRSRSRESVHQSHPSVLQQHQQHVADSRKVQQNQAKMIEKLLLKLKKMKKHQVEEDFAIFNLNNDSINPSSEKNPLTQSKQQLFLENYNVELTTYKENIQDLYDMMMMQSENKIHKQLEYEEQYQQLRSYLKLQHQLGNLRKYRYDESFQTMLDIPRLVTIADQFKANEQPHHCQKLYLNYEQLVKSKNKTFLQFYEQVMKTIGQFYVIFQQMSLHKNKNVQMQRNLECYKVEHKVGAEDDHQKKYELTMIQQLQKELDDKVKRLIELNQTVEVLKSESEIAPEVFQQIISSLNSLKSNKSKDKDSKSNCDLAISGSQKPPNQQESNNRNNRFSTKKDFMNKPPQSFQKRGRSLGMSAGKTQSQSKIFGCKKPWLDINPDLQNALDRLQAYEKEYDIVEKERDLYQGEYNKQRKDNEELAEQIKQKTKEHQELDLLSQDQLIKLKEQKEKILNLELENEKYEKKVQRLSDLNEELRELIEQERDMYLEEINRVKDSCEKKMQSKVSQDILVKNKLMQLATHYRVFIASSFNMEQILDSILEQLGNKNARRGSLFQVQKPYPLREKSPQSFQRIEQKISPDTRPSSVHDLQTPIGQSQYQAEEQARLTAQARQPRFEPSDYVMAPPVPASPIQLTQVAEIKNQAKQDQEEKQPRSPSKNMDKMVSNYEEDLRKIEAMKQQNLSQKYHKDLFDVPRVSQMETKTSALRQKSHEQQRSPMRSDLAQHNARRSPSARGYSHNGSAADQRSRSRVEESFQYNNNADRLFAERGTPYKSDFESDYQQQYNNGLMNHQESRDENQTRPTQDSQELRHNPDILLQQQQTQEIEVIYRPQLNFQNTFLKRDPQLSDLIQPSNHRSQYETFQYQNQQPQVLQNKQDILIQQKLQHEEQNHQYQQQREQQMHQQQKQYQQQQQHQQSQQQSVLSNERNNFQEKLMRLRSKLNGPSGQSSLGSVQQMVCAGIPVGTMDSTGRQMAEPKDINSFNSSSFLKQQQINQSPNPPSGNFNDIFSPQQNTQLEQSINQRLKEFENEQMQRQAQLAGRQ